MKTLYLTSALMLLSTLSWAKSLPQTHQSLSNIMTEVRDPFFNSSKRLYYLQYVQTSMQLKLARELKVNKKDLSKTFITNPKSMDLLYTDPWFDLQTEFYTTLHQEILSRRWNSKLAKKKVSDYGKNLADAMIFHLGKYSGTKEGRLYTRWNSISVNSAGKTSTYRMPYFVFSDSISTLLSLDAHTPYEDFLPKDGQETMGNPSLSTFIKTAGTKSREDNQELAEKIQLNHRIYIRAVANSAKTVASVYYLTGEYSLAETEKKVAGFIAGYCEGCSAKEKKDYQMAAINYVQKTKKEFSQVYNGSKDIVTSFCADLKHNGYHFPEPASDKKPTDPWKMKEYQITAIDNTRVDKSHIYAQLAMIQLEALRKSVAEHDLGVLFLTGALSNVRNASGKPSGTYLGCRPETLDADMGHVRAAIYEARKNVEQYISQVNTKVRSSALNNKDATDTLEFFTQTNVSATAEAVMTFPQGINLVVDSMMELDGDVRRRKRIDKIVTWGGTIVGVALTISGIGAPEGVAILLAVGAMAKGAISGTYYLIRSQQEKAFYKDLSNARKGLGNNFYLGSNLSAHYNDYRDLRINYIVDFAGSVLSFAKIHKIAFTRSAGDVGKANGLIKSCLQKAKAAGEDIGQDQLAEMLLDMTI